MTVADALDASAAKPAGKRPWFMEREVERVLAITMAVAQELAVARARIDTLERLLARKGVLDRAEIEDFQPAPAEAAERGEWIQEYLVRILRVVQQEAEAGPGDLAPEDVASKDWRFG